CLAEECGSARNGFLAVALLIAVPVFLKDGFYSGLEMCFVALVALSALLSLRARRPIDGLWAALPLAYAFFVRPTALFFLPLYLILIYHNNRRFRSSIVVFLLTFAVLAGAGYQIENHLEPPALNPAKPLNHLAFNLLLATESHPGNTLDERLIETNWELVRKLWPQIVEKLARSTKATYQTIPRILPVWLLVLATIGIVWRASPPVKLLSIGAAISGFAVIVGINLTTPMSTTRHLLPITAMAAVIAGVGSQALLQRWRAALTRIQYVAAVLAVVALIGYPVAFHLVEQGKIAAARMSGHVVTAPVVAYTSYDDIVVAPYCVGSDISWYARRRCVVLPDNPADVKRLVQKLVPAKLVLLCGEHHP
ncbi:MAG: glycosyltransferase family 39 protein, partial [Armatimonadetes bacterium]|nr:glycosyltransferase family 39 protein [Armatimonadota bacterium]